MSASWVAGDVRARAIAREALGAPAIRQIALAPSLSDAVKALDHTAYGRWIPAGATLAGAQHGVAASVLWHLRVLAGWLPPDGVQVLRTLAGWYEIANVDQHLA